MARSSLLHHCGPTAKKLAPVNKPSNQSWPLPNAHIMTAPVTSPLSSEYAVMAASVVNKCNAIEIERPFRIRHLVTYNFAFHYSLRQLAGGAVMNCVGGTAAILSRTKNQEPNCRWATTVVTVESVQKIVSLSFKYGSYSTALSGKAPLIRNHRYVRTPT